MATYQIGEYVQVIRTKHGHCLEIGSVHRIMNVQENSSDERMTWYSLRPEKGHCDSGYWVKAYEVRPVKMNSIRFKTKRTALQCSAKLSTNN